MGDLPFVVGLDSADVWANHSLFHLNQRLGTPPDDTSPDGQDWGLPVYDWAAMARDGFSWIRARASRAGELYSLFRVDHALGCYRTYARSRDGTPIGFSPSDEWEQVQLGEKLMRIMSRFAEVVAEDLGTVPPFLRPSLERVGVPGYRVLRWERDADGYRDPDGLAGDVGRDQRDPRHRHHRGLVRRADAGRTRGASARARAGRASIRRARSTTRCASCCWRRSTRRRRRWR